MNGIFSVRMISFKDVISQITFDDYGIPTAYADSLCRDWIIGLEHDVELPHFAISYYVGQDSDLRHDESLEDWCTAGDAMDAFDEVLVGLGLKKGDLIWIVFEE